MTTQIGFPKIRWLLLASSVFAAFAGPASAATRFAEPGGNGPEPCLQGDPCEIHDAIEGTNVGLSLIHI